MTKKKKIILASIIFGIIGLLVGSVIFRNSFAAILQNDVEVEEESFLTYYLNISYDGIDKYGVTSNDTTIADVKSGMIEVVDKIPDGLNFEGFVTTENGKIGSVRRNDNTSACEGIVFDDTNEDSNEGEWNDDDTEFYYHGLHYDANTRTVRFKIKNLQAGCVLTVGIKTMTPTIDDPNTPFVETRRDFYNFASTRENEVTVDSNTVHAYMGVADDVYTVTYQYTGDVPANAPNPPAQELYAVGASVGVKQDVLVGGYEFSGWTTTDVTVTDGSYEMPSKTVVFTGSFTSLEKYKVSYEVTGIVPNGYVIPAEKMYYPKTNVEVDSILKPGDIYNGYRFLGWTTEDAVITSDNDFLMGSNNVKLVGRFEEATYTVTYRFYDDPLPPNSESLLPETKSYRVGETVSLEDIQSPSGYEFLGWYYEDTFTMPAEDIVIYGEWQEIPGYFEPTISKIVINEGPFQLGQIINFKTTVTNTAAFEIQDVIVKENLEGATYVENSAYEILSDHYVTIPSIAPGSSVDVYSNYLVKEEDSASIVNEVEIVGALDLATGYLLNDKKEYKATATADLASKVTVCKTVSGASTDKVFQFQITGTKFETWLSMKKDECRSVYVGVGNYVVKEIIPQEYSLISVTGAINNNSGTLSVQAGNNYRITFTNTFTQKGFLHSSGRVENKIEVGGE